MAGEEIKPAVMELTPGERISRFMFGDRHYSAKKRLLKPGAFNPSPYDELSVGHTTGLDTAQIWQLGEVVRAHTKSPTLYARADLDVAHVLEQKLKAVRDDQDYERHTNVIGWPVVADDDAKKRLWKHIASELADKATLVLPSD